MISFRYRKQEEGKKKKETSICKHVNFIYMNKQPSNAIENRKIMHNKCTILDPYKDI